MSGPSLGTPKSSTHHLLAELASLGIVRRTEDGRYSLGPRLLYWGEAAADTFDMRAIAEQPMRRLRDELGESIHLYVREHDTRICIAAVEGRHELRPFIQLGRPLPLRAGRPASCCLPSPTARFSEPSLRARQAIGIGCPTRQGTSSAISWPPFARTAGQHPSASARRACRQLRRPSSIRATGSWPRCASPPRPRVCRSLAFDDLRPPLEAAAAEISRLLQSG